ncbi:hypothetical protein CB1_000877050 [Camelus ferus]|nr:hypothetical protein CB1_000877050 [Camelus ferus]
MHDHAVRIKAASPHKRTATREQATEAKRRSRCFPELRTVRRKPLAILGRLGLPGSSAYPLNGGVKKGDLNMDLVQGPIYSSSLGHCLVIFHLADIKSLRNPAHNALTDLAQLCLSLDDVNGIQSLYGPPPASPKDTVMPTESVPPEPGTPAACDPALPFDAVSTLRGEVLFFKDSFSSTLPLRDVEDQVLRGS